MCLPRTAQPINREVEVWQHIYISNFGVCSIFYIMFKVLAKTLCIALVSSMMCDAFAPIQPFSRTIDAPSACVAKDPSNILKGLSISDARSNRKGLTLANHARGRNSLGMSMVEGSGESSGFLDEIKWMPSCVFLTDSEPEGESPVLPLFPLGGYVYLVSLPYAYMHHGIHPACRQRHQSGIGELTKTNHFSWGGTTVSSSA